MLAAGKAGGWQEVSRLTDGVARGKGRFPTPHGNLGMLSLSVALGSHVMIPDVSPRLSGLLPLSLPGAAGIKRALCMPHVSLPGCPSLVCMLVDG